MTRSWNIGFREIAFNKAFVSLVLTLHKALDGRFLMLQCIWKRMKINSQLWGYWTVWVIPDSLVANEPSFHKFISKSYISCTNPSFIFSRPDKSGKRQIARSDVHAYYSMAAANKGTWCTIPTWSCIASSDYLWFISIAILKHARNGQRAYLRSSRPTYARPYFSLFWQLSFLDNRGHSLSWLFTDQNSSGMNNTH